MLAKRNKKNNIRKKTIIADSLREGPGRQESPSEIENPFLHLHNQATLSILKLLNLPY